MRRLGRIVVLLLTLGILYSGPVAACVCLEGSMAAMPCCPDEPQDFDVFDVDLPGVTTACDPAPAELLPSGFDERPAPFVIPSATPPAWQTHAPPRIVLPPTPEPLDALPIYLATLRLRI